MTNTEAKLHPQEAIKLGSFGSKAGQTALVLGALFTVATVVLGLVEQDHMRRFYHAYLVAFCYFLSIAVGALFFVMLQHLVSAKWSVVIRRIAEILASTFPLLLVLFLAGILVPMLLGSDGLYSWSSAAAHDDHHIHVKAAYLNVPFFAARTIAYFVIWTLLARYFFRKSIAQDESGDPLISDQQRFVSGPAIIVFAFVTAFAAFDILMSLHPTWYSTMFGVYFFAGAAVSIFALLALIPMVLQRAGKLVHSITVEHYHDVGKLLFAFVFFWGYIAFSQFMLMWYANIPEETSWYHYRMFGSGWTYVSILLVLGHFCFPFFCLLSRWTKRRLGLLAMFSVWMLVMHFVDLYWLVIPEYSQHLAWLAERAAFAGIDAGIDSAHVVGKLPDGIGFKLMDITAMVGIGGLFFASAIRTGKRVNLIPVKDPGLGESLAFENY